METRKCSIIISRQKAFTFSSIGLQRNGTRTKVDCFHSLGNDFTQIFMRLWALNNTNLETLKQIKGKGVHFRLMCVSEKRLKTYFGGMSAGSFSQTAAGNRAYKSLGFVCSPSFFSLPATCCLFSRGVIFTPARVSLTLLSLRKNGGLLVVYWY